MRISYITVFVLVIIGVGYWFAFHASASQKLFYNKLDSLIQSNAAEINLSDIMEGDWEMACRSDGYDQNIHIAKYNRTYKPVGAMDENAWGVIFISADGTYKSVTGWCSKGGVSLNLRGCMDRAKSILYKREPQQGDNCPSYEKKVTEAEQKKLTKSIDQIEIRINF